MRKGIQLFLSGLIGAAIMNAIPSFAEQPVEIIPKPAQVERLEGTFTIYSDTPIAADPADAASRRVADYLAERLYSNPVVNETPSGPGILLSTAPEDSSLGEESYTLEATTEHILIGAKDEVGLFYGVQSLLQIVPAPLPPATEGAPVPCVRIADEPRFSWRGLMLDCSRTFLPKDYIKRYIDLLAFYKMNVLHLHLTDDQGWRVQIDSHPKLTEIGAKWDPRYPDEISGYYTKDDIREMVQYAEARHVTIVPEIEMPSHCLALLTAYPELSCRGDKYCIVPFMQMMDQNALVPPPPYGVLCVGNEEVFHVMEDVLTEVITLFPSKYIHIGGDECPKDFWKTCPKCQARIKEEGLEDEEGLQSYFVRRIERFINAEGRILVGWDEILEGGLAPNATVMSWRGIEGGIAAAQQGHDVVMSPTTHCYFDYYYHTTPVEKTYAFEPVPDALTADEAHHILGAQGNMWTHIERTEHDIDWMVLPRTIALAEVTWSPKEARDWDDFRARLAAHYARLDARGFNYYVAAPAPELAIAPDGTPWVVADGAIMRLGEKSWEKQAGAAHQVAFSPEGELWVVGVESVPGGYAVLEWKNGAWNPLPDVGAISIAAGPNGRLWAVDSNNRVRLREEKGWKDLPGNMRRVAVGPDGTVWGVGTSTLPGGYELFKWTGQNWEKLGPDAAAVTGFGGPHETFWVATDLSTLWVYRDSAWHILPGNGQVIAVGADGSVFALDYDRRHNTWHLLRWTGEAWSRVAHGDLPAAARD